MEMKMNSKKKQHIGKKKNVRVEAKWQQKVVKEKKLKTEPPRMEIANIKNSWPQYSRYKMENVYMLHTASHKKGSECWTRAKYSISSAYDTVWYVSVCVGGVCLCITNTQLLLYGMYRAKQCRVKHTNWYSVACLLAFFYWKQRWWRQR